MNKPTIEEIRSYCESRKNAVDPEQWYDHYESNGWMVGRTKMKNWQAAVRTWERNGFQKRDIYAEFLAKGVGR